jgi:hypothetical protein
MGRWKEEVEKFIVSRYHQGYLWLNEAIEITGGLLYRILGIPREGAKVPKSTNSNDWMQFLTGSTTTKNSKGLLINKITDPKARWDCHHNLFVLHTSRTGASDVNMTMVEAIAQVYQNSERFNWAEHLADMLRTNCKEVQDSGRAIKFPSLLIWIEMEQYGPVGEATFTSKKTPTMEKYRVFSFKSDRYIKLTSTRRDVLVVGRRLER